MSNTPDSSPRSLARNAASQIIGRLALSLGRLAAALMVVRLLGPADFGAYALVLQFIFLFEWLVDFGQSDIGVREMLQRPDDEHTVFAALVRLKLIQGVLLALALPCLLLVLDYPAAIIEAGIAGGVSIACSAGVQVFRTRFKLRMRMERDVAAEIGGLAIVLPLTLAACLAGLGTPALIASYAAGRAAFLALVILFSRDVPWIGPGPGADSWHLFRHALPLGIGGLLVSLYDSLATVMLSKLTDLEHVAQFAAATRFVFPVIIIVQALGSVFFPPLAAAYGTNPARFRKLQQASLDIAVFVGGGLFAGIFAGAGFLMDLMGARVGEASGVLQLMTIVVLARAITTSMSPLLIVSHRQGRALWLTVLSVALQFGALMVLVPLYGIMGAAIGYLGIELLVSVVPVSVIGQVATGVRLNWSTPLRLIACGGVAVGLCAFLPLERSIWAGILAGLIYLALVLGTFTISIASLRSLAADIRAPRAAPSPT